MKKTSKPNPLKTFNDNKAMAYKKAGGAMKAFKKSLTKAQDGIMFKGSDLAKQYAKAPMVGAEPEFSALQAERTKALLGPSTSDLAYASPYTYPTWTSDGKGGRTKFDDSNYMNDPRFSKNMEKTNEFYNKEKNAGTLFSSDKKGFNTRYRDAGRKVTTATGYNQFNPQMKKGGAVKSKKK